MTKPTQPYFHAFHRDGHDFIVRAREDGEGKPFLGFHQGVLSVEADRADIACRALLRKHIAGLPEGELVVLADRLLAE